MLQFPSTSLFLGSTVPIHHFLGIQESHAWQVLNYCGGSCPQPFPFARNKTLAKMEKEGSNIPIPAWLPFPITFVGWETAGGEATTVEFPFLSLSAFNRGGRKSVKCSITKYRRAKQAEQVPLGFFFISDKGENCFLSSS